MAEVKPSKGIVPKNGDSIGIVGDKGGSGTLGGFVELHVGSPGLVRTCAVTCHHVACWHNRDTDAFAEFFKLQPPNSTNPHATQMRSPSQLDYENALAI